MKRTYEISKRVFDLIAVIMGLAVLSPFMLIFYLLVRCTSRGSGFFVQGRAGRNGRLFRMVKFRTMRADHVHDPDPTIVITDAHEAVTPVGRFLRKFKLDELPQLFNVLAGHMSLVGPRPTVPEQVAEYGEFERRRLLARPGITGLAQVNGGTGLTWPERIEWDVYYVEHRTLIMDLKILLRTAVSLIVGTEKNVRRFKD
jgi:lipopolysaccharide/colanic/teichoic acid biosynthesis glycosyltransferase